MSEQTFDRRDWIKRSLSGVAATAACPWIGQPFASEPTNPSHGWLRKTLKFNMIGVEGGLAEKMAAARQAGFEGVEPNVPLANDDEVQSMTDAASASGIIIDGTVGGYHWQIRHTDPDPEVRRRAADRLAQGIRQTAAMNADTMLLVPGHGKDGDAGTVRRLATEAVRQALPTAEENGVKILIENVWNQMFYDPSAGDQQTADDLAAFIDAFDSPWIGVQYDIGNHWKFGDPAAWIRTLGDRIVKLDIKGFSRSADQFTKITEGDIRWDEVKGALRDIGYRGWLAAEVRGGDLGRLKEISDHLDEALQCSETI